MVKSIEFGADLINDVSGFSFDENSIKKIKKYNRPKVLHHMKGTPNTMQINPNYKNVLLDIDDQKLYKEKLKENNDFKNGSVT